MPSETWCVWLTEYPDEGSVEVEAESQEDAVERGAKMLDVDQESVSARLHPERELEILRQERDRLATENQKLRSAVKAAGQREAWLGEVLLHAEARMAEDGCDCGTDEPGSCALCLVQAAIRSPSPSAEAIRRVLEAVSSTVEAFERGYSSKEEHAVLAKKVSAAYRALQALRSGQREGQPLGKEG